MNLGVLHVTPSICQAWQKAKQSKWVPVFCHPKTFSAIPNVLTASSCSSMLHFLVFTLLLSSLQVSRLYCPSTCGTGLCRQLSATSAVMRRASLCAGTTTAGASVPWTTHSVTAPRWILRLWRPVCWKSEIHGIWPTKTLRSQVSIFPLFFTLVQWLWPSHWQQIRLYC